MAGTLITQTPYTLYKKNTTEPDMGKSRYVNVMKHVHPTIVMPVYPEQKLYSKA